LYTVRWATKLRVVWYSPSFGKTCAKVSLEDMLYRSTAAFAPAKGLQKL